MEYRYRRNYDRTASPQKASSGRTEPRTRNRSTTSRYNCLVFVNYFALPFVLTKLIRISPPNSPSHWMHGHHQMGSLSLGSPPIGSIQTGDCGRLWWTL